MNICAVTREHVFGNEDFPLKECFHCIFYSVALIAFADRLRQWILQVQLNAASAVFAGTFLFLLSVDQMPFQTPLPDKPCEVDANILKVE